MKNIELKAQLHDREKTEKKAVALGARFEGHIRQCDTYFNVPGGRFKLRVCEPGESYLVFYKRSDEAGPKACEYDIQAVSPAIREILSNAIGVLTEVVKTRALYLWENVRIHFDRVEGLGEFLEFEAVLSKGYDAEDGYSKVRRLREEFQIADEDLVPVSYMDLMLRRSPT